MGYFRVYFKADYFLFSQVVDFSAVKAPRSLRGKRLTILLFELFSSALIRAQGFTIRQVKLYDNVEYRKQIKDNLLNG